MKVDLRSRDDVAVVDLRGRFVTGVGNAPLRTALDDLLADGWRKIVVNLSEVPAIDSSGIGELVEGKKVAEHFGGELKLVELGDRIRHILTLGMILPLFETFETEDAAVESFD